MSMPAITLWQPYASLIACGAKRYETRHWRPPAHVIGKRVAIHAAARRPTGAEVEGLFDDVAEALGFCHWQQRIPYGAIVCTATLADCFRVTDRGRDQVCLAGIRWIQDDGFGDYEIGRYCWEMRDVQQLPPIPAKGAQGFWVWDHVAGAN